MDKNHLSDKTDERSPVTEELGTEESSAAEVLEAEAEEVTETEETAEKEKKTEHSKSAEKIVMRAVAIVALIVLIVAVTPLRGYVAGAAGDVHDWAALTFHTGTKKSSKGCKIEIVDVKAINDFVYLTVDETYSKSSLKKDGETSRYILPDIDYSGSINAKKGDSIRFDSNNFLYLQYDSSDYEGFNFDYSTRSVNIDDDWFKKNKELTIHARYKIYLPYFTDSVDGSKTYTCSLKATSEDTGSKMNLIFALDDIDETVNSQVHFSGQMIDVDEVTFVFQQLDISSSCIDAILEWDDEVDMSAYDLHVGADLDVYKTDDSSNKLHLTTYLENGLTPDEDDSHFARYLYIEDKCYLILSDYDSEYDFTNSDITVKINDLHCDYSGLVKNYHELKDIVLKNKKVDDENYNVDINLNLGEVQIHIDSVKRLHPDQDIYSDYPDSTLAFVGSLTYTGENTLSHWRGFMDLVNPKTKEKVRFSIKYYDIYQEEIDSAHVRNGLEIQSYYIGDPDHFLKTLSQWHIDSITEFQFVTRNDKTLIERLSYENKWQNPKYADNNYEVATFRGLKYLNLPYVE